MTVVVQSKLKQTVDVNFFFLSAGKKKKEKKHFYILYHALPSKLSNKKAKKSNQIKYKKTDKQVFLKFSGRRVLTGNDVRLVSVKRHRIL